jgi:hypothetical protein
VKSVGIARVAGSDANEVGVAKSLDELCVALSICFVVATVA